MDVCVCEFREMLTCWPRVVMVAMESHGSRWRGSRGPKRTKRAGDHVLHGRLAQRAGRRRRELLLALGVQPAPVSSGGADAAVDKENGGGVVDENARIPLEKLRRHRAFAAVAPPLPNRSHL